MNKFKYFFVFMVLAQANNHNVNASNIFSTVLDNCIETNNLSRIDMLHNWNLIEYPEDNSKFSTFFVCVYTELGVIKKDVIDFDKLKLILPSIISSKYNYTEDEAKKLIGEINTDDCFSLAKDYHIDEYAIRIRNCIVEDLRTVMKSDDWDTSQSLGIILHKCIETHDLPNNIEIWNVWNQAKYPENNPQFTKLLLCVFTETNMIKNDAFDFKQVLSVFPTFVELKFHVDKQQCETAVKVMNTDVCFKLPKHADLGIYAVRMRNCLFDELAKVSTTEEPDKTAFIRVAMNHCSHRSKSPTFDLYNIWGRNENPEDDPEYTKFHTCLLSKIYIIKNDAIDLNMLKEIFPRLLSSRYEFNNTLATEVAKRTNTDVCMSLSKNTDIGIHYIRIHNCFLKEADKAMATMVA